MIIWGGRDESKYYIPYFPTFTRISSLLDLGEEKIKEIALGYSHILISTEK